MHVSQRLICSTHTCTCVCIPCVLTLPELQEEDGEHWAFLALHLARRGYQYQVDEVDAHAGDHVTFDPGNMVWKG